MCDLNADKRPASEKCVIVIQRMANRPHVAESCGISQISREIWIWVLLNKTKLVVVSKFQKILWNRCSHSGKAFPLLSPIMCGNTISHFTDNQVENSMRPGHPSYEPTLVPEASYARGGGPGFQFVWISQLCALTHRVAESGDLSWWGCDRHPRL